MRDPIIGCAHTDQEHEAAEDAEKARRAVSLMSRIVDEAAWPALVAEARRTMGTTGDMPRARLEAYAVSAAVWNYLLHHPDDARDLIEYAEMAEVERLRGLLREVAAVRAYHDGLRTKGRYAVWFDPDLWLRLREEFGT